MRIILVCPIQCLPQYKQYPKSFASSFFFESLSATAGAGPISKRFNTSGANIRTCGQGQYLMLLMLHAAMRTFGRSRNN